MHYELSDYEWSVIKPMLPNKPRGVPRVADRRILNGIFWVLRSGAPWRDLSSSYGPHTTCYKRGAWANIPPKRNRRDPICFSPYLYRDRNLVERFFNKIKQCRRVATRYDKLAANYLAFVKLACIRLWLRVYESTA
jgi:transposase